jgi:hypothetical protein
MSELHVPTGQSTALDRIEPVGAVSKQRHKAVRVEYSSAIRCEEGTAALPSRQSNSRRNLDRTGHPGNLNDPRLLLEHSETRSLIHFDVP